MAAGFWVKPVYCMCPLPGTGVSECVCVTVRRNVTNIELVLRRVDKYVWSYF